RTGRRRAWRRPSEVRPRLAKARRHDPQKRWSLTFDPSFTMAAKPPPATPDALSIASALAGSEPLGRLRAALRDSQARYEAIRPILPPALAPHVRPGPLDAEGWSLLASN